MNIRFLIIISLLLSVASMTAQKALNVVKKEHQGQSFTQRACDNDAGTVELDNFLGQSIRNDIEDTIFLCWLDRFYLEHNGDQNLTGDPDMSTQAGIGYAWYDGIPTITGPDLTSIEGDPQAYQPSGEMVVYVDEINGDAIFENGYYDGSTTFNQYISGGNITQKYFAPITFDDKIGSQAQYEGMPAGECVNARVDEAFTVVYLNEIKASNLTTHFMGDPFRVSFDISGGMPEFDGSDYSEIIVQLKNKTSVKGTLAQNSYTHGDQVEFTVSEFGLYQIIMRDGVSCEVIDEVNVQENPVPVFILDTISGIPGEIVCVSWSVSNFVEIQFVLGALKFDPSVVAFSHFNAMNGHDITGIGTVIGPDWVSIWWELYDVYSLPDGEVIVEACFEIVGDPGDCAPFYFDNTSVVYTDVLGGESVPNQETGMICVDPPDGLHVEVDLCGSRSTKDEGSVTFEVFNGTGPFTFVFQTSGGGTVLYSGTIPEGAGKITLEDIPAGLNYELIITDNTGTVINKDVDIITIENPLTINFNSIQNPTCFGFNDGSLSVEVFGGFLDFSTYSIAWSTGDYGVDNLIDLGSGNYSVTVTGNYTGCETEAFMNLTVPPIEVELNILDTAFCADSGGGRIEALASGGTPKLDGYDFDWTSGAIDLEETNWSSEFDNVPTGMVYVTITDNYPWCFIEDSIEMPYLYDLEVESLLQDPLCNGDENGNIQLLASLGDYDNASFTFFPIPPYNPSSENFTTIGSDSLFADSLGAGFYRIEITEINSGCKTVEDYFFTNPTLIQSSITVSGLGCGNGELGSATIQISGGSNPFIITSGSGLPDVTIPSNNGTHEYTDLDEGIYYLTIIDDAGCSMLDTFEIKGTDQLLSIDSLVYTPFDCIPNPTTDIVVHATSSDGVNTFNDKFYTWIKDGAVIDIDSTLENAGPGLYYIEVSNSKGCSTIDSIELFAPDLFTLDVAITEPECEGGNGGSLGSICVNTNGGTPGFTYQWNDGSPPDQPCLDNLSEGSYSLLVTDVNNCLVDTTIIVNGPTAIDVDILDVSGISCNNGQTFDGGVTLTASGGDNPTDVYSYLLSSGTSGFGQVHVANDLEGGENWVLVSFNTQSGNVCFADTVYFDIDVPEVLEMDYTSLFVQDVSCNSACDGIAIISAQGGNDLFYNYDWIENGASGAAVADLCGGTYHIEITDANGCTVMDSITVNEPDSLIAYIDPNNTNGINCFGEDSGQIQVLHDGGNFGGGFTYTWQNTDATGTLATGLSAGYYSVTVEDEKGCSDWVEVTLEANDPIIAIVAEPDAIECYGGSTCISIESASGGAGTGYDFSINSGPNYSLDSCITVYASEVDYLVEVYDKEGCSYSTMLNIDQPNPIEVDLGGDIEVGLGEQATLNAQISADNPVQAIIWEPVGENDICLGPNCQMLEIHPEFEQLYEVTVVDSKGCMGYDDILVTVNTRRNVFIPNIFSPNGDSHNDKFQFFTGSGVEFINYYRIFDRWGELIWEESNLTPDITGVGNWDGSYRGKELSPGVFVYLIEVDFIDGRRILYRGSITLLK